MGTDKLKNKVTGRFAGIQDKLKGRIGSKINELKSRFQGRFDKLKDKFNGVKQQLGIAAGGGAAAGAGMAQTTDSDETFADNPPQDFGQDAYQDPNGGGGPP